MLVAYATLPYYNTQHAVTTAHTGILNGQASMPDYQKAWYLQAATPMLARSTFIPNHPEFGRYNGILFKAIQGVETGRLSPEDAVEFLEDELSNELGDKSWSSTGWAGAGGPSSARTAAGGTDGPRPAATAVDRLLFLGPATLLLVLFFLAPVIVNLGLAFTDMGRNLKVTELHDRERRSGCWRATAGCQRAWRRRSSTCSARWRSSISATGCCWRW